MCVRVNEKDYIVCARNRRCIDLCFSFKSYILFSFLIFFFFFKLSSPLKPRSVYRWLMAYMRFVRAKRNHASRAIDLISNRPKRSAVDERKRTRNFQRGTRYESNFTFRTRIRSSIFEGKIVILVETCLLFELNVEVLDRDI